MSINGIVTMVFPTNHAIGLVSDEGCELLIHIEIDTVNLDGQPFSPYVNVDDKVRVGDKLIGINLDMIKESGLSSDTSIIITNDREFDVKAAGKVNVNDELMKIK